jgi:hypothetical protein
MPLPSAFARLASGHPVSSTGQAFEQPKNREFFNTLLKEKAFLLVVQILANSWSIGDRMTALVLTFLQPPLRLTCPQEMKH